MYFGDGMKRVVNGKMASGNVASTCLWLFDIDEKYGS